MNTFKMSGQSFAAFCLAWGILIINTNASAFNTLSRSSIIEATHQKHNLLLSRQLQTNNNPPLTDEQLNQCIFDQFLADTSRDNQLDKSEYLRFLSLNSAHYGYQWGYASNQLSLGALPLEFPMLFHSTACMCAYEQVSVDFGCCEGDAGHIIVYGDMDDTMNMTLQEEAYTRLFCTEAYYAYGATFMPTRRPTPMPSDGPSVSPSTVAPTSKATTGSPTTDQLRTMSPTTNNGTATSPPTTMMTTSPVKLPTTSPTKIVPSSLPTKSPVEQAVTASPTTSSPIATPATSSPIPTISPNSAMPVTSSLPATSSPVSITSSPVGTITGTPTSSGPISSSPSTKSPTSSTLAIGIQYGISSNCGMTAYDVMNGNYGITVKEGLVSATEVIVMDILNATYPRSEDDENNTRGVQKRMSPLADGDVTTTVGQSESAPSAPANGVIDNTISASASSSEAGNDHTTKEESPKTMSAQGVRVRIKGLPSNNGPLNRRLAMLASKQGQGPQSLHDLHVSQHRVVQQEQQQHLNSSTRQQQGSSRSLVYYTQTNPVIITDVEDVLDQACAPGFNCMVIKSTVYVTLEEGDDAGEVEGAIWEGIQDSLKDASFFDAIPADTIFCPPSPTASPAAGLTSPSTSSPTITQVVTNSPTSLSPVAVPATPIPTTQAPVAVVSTGTPTISPVADGVPTTLSPTEYRWPTFAPTTEFPSPLPSEAVTEIATGPLNVTITYDLANDCGLTAEDVMSGANGNTLKEGLIAATTSTVIGILNTTYPRAEDGEPTRNRRNMRGLLRQSRRQLVHINGSPAAAAELPSSQSNNNGHRNLVFYTDEYPVTIDRILDMETNCDPGQNCLLVISDIVVILEPGDDPKEVNDVIVGGMQASFEDNTFFGAIPSDTVICP